MFDAGLVEALGSSSLPNWGMFGLFALALYRSWPAIQAKINEARKIQADADAGLRKDLIERVEDLEQQLREERARCDKALREMRNKLTGTVRQFLSFQLHVAEAVPPTQRTPEIEALLIRLRGTDFKDWPEYEAAENDTGGK